MIAITGDPLRTNAYVFGHNGQLGYTVAKRVELPPDWSTLLAAPQAGGLESKAGALRSGT
jgi:hypothetical protein